MLFLTSSLLSVPHGFTLRTSGAVPRGSLNFSDQEPRLQENLQLLARAAGQRPEQLATVRQVHADRVVRAALGAEEAADGLWTHAGSGLWVGVKSADCVPVLLASADGRRVAAVHSGWRGTALRVVARAVERLLAEGERPSTLRAAVGPCIQACCYEVGPELAERFVADFGSAVVRTGGRRPHLDLSGAVRATLLGAGLLPEAVDVQAACTACEPARFFSHRRDGGAAGRHLAFIAPSPLS